MKPVCRLVLASFDRPAAVLIAAAAVTLLAAVALLGIRIDTDPENMLSPSQPDRVVYDELKRDFGIHDMIVVGVIDPEGAFRPETLAAVAAAIDSILELPGVIPEDVVSLTTTDNPQSLPDLVDIRPVMARIPATAAEADSLRRAVAANPYLDEVVASKSGDAVAIYVPLAAKEHSYAVAAAIRGLLERALPSGVRYRLAGLPIAEDTFGHEMFVEMAVVAPVAFAGILLLVLLIFGEISFLAPVGLVAALTAVWTMGALVGTGFTVHIMASMIPVFLLPIAVLDSVHLLSEFQERRHALGDRRQALDDSMRVLSRPLAFTSLTSAVGFASLGLANIPPVRVFGLFVAIGIGIAWLLTHTVVPALLGIVSLRAERTARATRAGRMAPILARVGAFSFRRAGRVLAVAALLAAVGAAGVSRLRSDDNPVRWFREGHPMRVAHDELNARFGGTYMAHLLVEGETPGAARRPEVIAWMDRLQRRLEQDPAVGKTSSVADIVRRLNRVLHDGDTAHDRVPMEPGAIGQILFLFQGSGDPGDLDNFLTRDGRRANVWVQLRDGDNHVMQRVEDEAAAALHGDPAPQGIDVRWTGLNHINLVWQRLMVLGMLQAILGSFVVVFVLMAAEFRSWGMALLAMVPLSVAIVTAYGLVGLAGHRYDMPIAICSSLSLGLGIDFAIHVLERYRSRWREDRDLQAANRHVFGAPGLAIARNAVIISLGFLPLAMSTLTPYVTVGLFFAALMVSAALATLILLPALLRVTGGRMLS